MGLWVGVDTLEGDFMFITPSHILLVDDEEDFLEMLSLRLKESGESVLTATSVEKGLSVLEEEAVDVVILDVKMPEMDGIEVLQEIKKRHPLIEVIMLTGHGTVHTAVQGMKLGAFDFLLKPADFDDLLDMLKQARQRYRDQAERIQKAEAAMTLRRSRI
jgi:DNA-binding NtrC family response regulator